MTDHARPALTRRGLIKTVGAGVGAAAVGYGAGRLDGGPVGTANAVAATTALGVGLAGGAALSYLTKVGADAILGDNRDYSGYTGGEALHQEIVAGAYEMRSADERVMTSIKNNLNNSKNVALTKGKAAIIKEMNAGNGESAATDAMQAAIDDYYSTIQKNLITHHNAQLEQFNHHIEQVLNHADLTASNLFVSKTPSASSGDTYRNPSSNSVTTHSVTLYDGTEIDVKSREFTNSSNTFEIPVPGYDYNDSHFHGIIEPDGSTEVYYLRTRDLLDTWNTLTNKRDDVNAQLSGFVKDVYAAYEPGEIPTEEIVDPITASTELRQDYDGYQTQGAHAAMMGIPTQSARSVYMELHDDQVRVWADIYTEYTPTDSNGNEVGFQTGSTYSPSEWDAPLYIAYEVGETFESTATPTGTDSGSTATPTGSTATATATDTGSTPEPGATDFTQIEQDFTVVSAENKDGEQIDSFQKADTNTQTADVDKLEEELNQIRELQLEMQESAQTGGGGAGFDFSGFSFAGIPGVAVVAGGAAGLAGVYAWISSMDPR